MARKSPFSSQFQTDILKLGIEQPEWLTALKPSFFDDPMEGQAWRQMQAIHRATKRPVSLKALADAMLRRLGRTPTVRVMKPLLKPVKEGDRLYLMTELGKFVQFQTIGEALVKAQELYQRQDVDGMVKLVQHAARPIGFKGGDLGTNYFKHARERKAGSLTPPWILKTLIPGLDRCFLHGGAAPKTVNVVMSPPNIGKTWFLLWVAMATIIQGKNFVLITLDMSEDEIVERFDSLFTGINTRDLSKNAALTIQLLRRVGRRWGDRLMIKEMDPLTTTVSDIARYLNVLESRGFETHALGVDYDDLLTAEAYQNRETDGRYHEVGHVFGELRALGRKKNLVEWILDQPNRSAREHGLLGLEDTAESYIKPRLADFWMTINQTPEEAKRGMVRLWIPKNRKYITRVLLELKTNFQQGRFVSKVQPPPTTGKIETPRKRKEKVR